MRHRPGTVAANTGEIIDIPVTNPLHTRVGDAGMKLGIAPDVIAPDGNSPRPLGHPTAGGTVTRALRLAAGRATRGDSLERLLAGERHREASLVFRLARVGDDVREYPRLGDGADWPQLLQIAWDEGAVSALRDHWRALGAGAVPLEIDRRLACLALDRELRMRMLEQRTRESIGVLATAGIDVALLKGAGLAATLYGSFAARPMKDVDLLIDPARAEEAKRLMLSAGWERDHGLPDDEVYLGHHHLAPLIDARGSRSRLEIHRTLLPTGHPFALPMEELWDGMRSAEFGGKPVLVLDPTHHALHIAIHFAWSHIMRVGGWHAFRDLATLDDAGLLDWNELVRAATRARAASCCYWTLTLARRMTGLPVPDGVLAELAPAGSRALLARLERHFVHVLLRCDATRPSVGLDRALWNMAIQPQRQGHGAVRPWIVSLELTAARLPHVPVTLGDRALRRVRRAARSSAYIARLLWN